MNQETAFIKNPMSIANIEFKFRTFRIRSKEEQKMISRMIKTEADKMISHIMGHKPHSVRNRLSLY